MAAAQTLRQTAFAGEGVEAMSGDLTPRDLEVMRIWKTVKGQCPWCLFTGNLWSFATFHPKRKDQTVSEGNCRCPDCGVEMRRGTLIKIYGMSMDEYGKWFWDAVFSGSYGKVSWEPLKKRLRENFTYEERQPFWDQYWKHKELSLGGWESGDDEDYEDYVATCGPEEDEPQ